MELQQIGDTGVYFSQPPNEAMRVYHTRWILTERNIELMRGGPQASCKDPVLTEGASDKTGIPQALIQIPGVTYLYLYSYEATITKGPLFDWPDIDSQVAYILATAKPDAV
jgi:hypothetical protein